jgi:hypothetical protein
MNKPVHVDELPFPMLTEAPKDLPKAPDKIADTPKKAASPPIADDPDKFDWDNPDEGSIVLREQRATAVYRNRAGEVIIRQKGPWPDEDSFLFISPENEVAFMERMAEQLRK